MKTVSRNSVFFQYIRVMESHMHEIFNYNLVKKNFLPQRYWHAQESIQKITSFKKVKYMLPLQNIRSRFYIVLK